MQGGHGGYGYGGGYGGYDDAGAYGSAGGGYGGYDAGGYYYSSGGNPSAAAAGEDPLGGLELQPSEACPRNYVIFDQTCTDSRVMFHPSLAHALGGPSSGHGVSGGGAWSPRRKEDDDAEEIDALLSSEDDDVASTGRTPGHDHDGSSSSPDSGPPRKKKERVKKMMRALKGIIPGGDQMDTPAVLDEVVRHLKSLKVEAKKLGVRGSSDR